MYLFIIAVIVLALVVAFKFREDFTPSPALPQNQCRTVSQTVNEVGSILWKHLSGAVSDVTTVLTT